VRRPSRTALLLTAVVVLMATVPVLIPLLVTKANGAPGTVPRAEAVATATDRALPRRVGEPTRQPTTRSRPVPGAATFAPTPSPTPSPTTPSPTPSATPAPAPPPAPTTTAPPSTAEAQVLSTEADLVVTQVTWSPAEPATGQPVTFSAVVLNQGGAATPDGTTHGVAFLVDGTKVTWSAGSTASLGPGESRTYTADGGITGATWLAIPGDHTLTADADDVNRIPETTETNNTATTPLKVT
jgi:hypothetical protein